MSDTVSGFLLRYPMADSPLTLPFKVTPIFCAEYFILLVAIRII